MKKEGKAKAKSKSDKGKFVFRSEHFYGLLERQSYQCEYSSRVLTPSNCTAEHVIPMRKQGWHAEDNVVLVDQHVGYLKRYLTPPETFQLALDIVKTMGKEYGYSVRKTRKV